MPTLHNNQDYDKTPWRKSNFDYVCKMLYEKKRPTESQALAWVEAFGRSGLTSMEEALQDGVIPKEEYFFGIDNDLKIFWEFYEAPKLPDEEWDELSLEEQQKWSNEERQRRFKSKRLRYGDIHNEVVDLAESNPIPIGVFNFDLLGMAGRNALWTESHMQSIGHAVYGSLKRIPQCILIFNYAAGTPAANKIEDMELAAQNQYVKIQDLLKRHLSRATSSFSKSSVPKCTSPRTRKQLDALKAGGSFSLNEYWEFYKSKGRYLPMVTTRLVVERSQEWQQ